ncbi:MAG: glycosyltransferase family 39 protein [Niabella sp.]
MGNQFHTVHYILLYSVLAIAYIMGLFVPLMDSDAAHHANIALHMYLHNDFVNLIDRGGDYLDKPHLLFWMAGAMYHVFGVNAFAYKLPSFIMSIAALIATQRLATKLYNKETGSLAALILASAQAFILACNDVRMDAILTACIILATWQLAEAATIKKWYNYILAALFLAMGFATKGLVGIIMPGIALFFYLLYKRDFHLIFNTRWLVVAVLLAVCMSPVVYCYYLQYDKHPEKVIRGMSHISGVKFILWGQNTERLEGKNWGGGKRDYFFYLHTMLWAFLPWSIITYYAIGSRLKFLFKTRFAYFKNEEGLTIGTIVLIFILISLSQFQLPHYLNILFPFFSILSAQKLLSLQAANRVKPLKILYIIQLVIVCILVPGILIISVWAFPVTNWAVIIPAFLLLTLTFYFIRRNDIKLVKIITVSVACMAFVNVLLNGNFYPKIMEYQGGDNLAAIARAQNIPVKKTVFYNAHSYTFDFLRGTLSPVVSLDDIKKREDNFWVFTDHNGLDSLKAAQLPGGTVFSSNQFRVTRLNIKFVNPRSRTETLEKYYLININNQP